MGYMSGVSPLAECRSLTEGMHVGPTWESAKTQAEVSSILRNITQISDGIT